jgi:hypothetical protein
VSHSLAGLNDVQMTVLASTLGGESYPAIADRSTYTVEYLREVESRLWQLIALALGEPVNKKNIRSVLQRYQQSLAVVELERQYSWGEAIDVSIFYGRTKELKTLDKWITKDRCRLIEILAMGGVTYSHRQPLRRSGGGFSNSQMRFLASPAGYSLSLHKQQTTVQSSVLAH